MKEKSKITCIIPAFNEKERISSILKIVKDCPLIAETIVVDDGSTDSTAEIVKRYFPITLISHKENLGKGAALQSGINQATGDILIFLDADLVGLTQKHLEELISPLLEDKNLMMTIGVFENRVFYIESSTKTWSFLSGQRAIRKKLLRGIDLSLTKFGAEMAVSKYALKIKAKTQKVFLPGLNHIIKEEKYKGKGFLHRLKMYLQIAIFSLIPVNSLEKLVKILKLVKSLGGEKVDD